MSYHNGSVWPHDNALIAYHYNETLLNGIIPALIPLS
jgi:glycogen debranching enzyme